MAGSTPISALKRDSSGRSPSARRLRKEGRVPGTLFGGPEPVSFSTDALETAALIRHDAHMLEVDIEGSKHTAIIKDYQLHPLRGTIEHLDLQEVRADQSVKLSVGVDIIGEPPGVKAGGVLTVSVHELNIEAKASEIPELITIDVSGLGLGDQLHLSDLTPPPGVTFLDDPGTTLAGITVPRGIKGGKTADEQADEDLAAAAAAASAEAREAAAEEG
jgi:large subunit ribosomal protein L25